jgi:hypothetical protein
MDGTLTIIDEVYKKHINSLFYDFSGEVKGYLLHEHLSKEEFIDKCKTDSEFSERWGLKIEERELSLEERSLIANSNHYEVSLNIKGIGVDGDVTLHTHLDELNIPTKLITLLYSNETIEVYE